MFAVLLYYDKQGCEVAQGKYGARAMNPRQMPSDACERCCLRRLRVSLETRLERQVMLPLSIR